MPSSLDALIIRIWQLRFMYSPRNIHIDRVGSLYLCGIPLLELILQIRSINCPLDCYMLAWSSVPTSTASSIFF